MMYILADLFIRTLFYIQKNTLIISIIFFQKFKYQFIFGFVHINMEPFSVNYFDNFLSQIQILSLVPCI